VFERLPNRVLREMPTEILFVDYDLDDGKGVEVVAADSK